MHSKCPFPPLFQTNFLFSGLTSFFSSCFPRASYYSISPTGLPSYFSELLWTSPVIRRLEALCWASNCNHYKPHQVERLVSEWQLQRKIWWLALFRKNSEQSFSDFDILPVLIVPNNNNNAVKNNLSEDDLSNICKTHLRLIHDRESENHFAFWNAALV